MTSQPLVEERDGQGQELIEHLFAHSAGDVAAELGHGKGEQVSEHRRKDIADRHGGAIKEDGVHVHDARLRVDGVDGTCRQHGRDEREHVAHHREEERRRNQAPVPRKILHQAEERRLFSHLIHGLHPLANGRCPDRRHTFPRGARACPARPPCLFRGRGSCRSPAPN